MVEPPPDHDGGRRPGSRFHRRTGAGALRPRILGLLDRRGADELRGHHVLQQLLRIRDGQVGPGAECGRLANRAMARRDRRAGGPARHLRFRRDRQRPDSRGADLPVPLCRGMVVGRALGRVRAEGPSRPGGRAALGEIRGLRDRRAGRGDGRCAARGNGFPVRRGAEARRGDAPADHCRRRGLRRADAETEGRADAPRGAVEIRLQVDQVGRPDQPRRRRAAGELEPAHSARIRLLFERESRARPPSLEPEDRTADRRGPVRAADSDAEVQRLRRRGRVALRRHGPRERVLLSHGACAADQRGAAPGADMGSLSRWRGRAVLVPLARPDRRARAGAGEGARARAGASGAPDARRRAGGDAVARHHRRQPGAVPSRAWPFDVLLCHLPPPRLALSRRAVSRRHREGHRQTALHHHRDGGLSSDAAARGDVEQPLDPEAGPEGVEAAAPADLRRGCAGGGAFRDADEDVGDRADDLPRARRRARGLAPAPGEASGGCLGLGAAERLRPLLPRRALTGGARSPDPSNDAEEDNSRAPRGAMRRGDHAPRTREGTHATRPASAPRIRTAARPLDSPGAQEDVAWRTSESAGDPRMRPLTERVVASRRARQIPIPSRIRVMAGRQSGKTGRAPR